MNGEIFLDGEIYSVEAVRLAANIFSDKLKIRVSRKREKVRVVFGSGDDALKGDFLNEVLNQQCRLDLNKKNGKIARMVVTKALLSAMGNEVTKSLA